jgi:hypothetical protein
MDMYILVVNCVCMQHHPWAGPLRFLCINSDLIRQGFGLRSTHI